MKISLQPVKGFRQALHLRGVVHRRLITVTIVHHRLVKAVAEQSVRIRERAYQRLRLQAVAIHAAVAVVVVPQ